MTEGLDIPEPTPVIPRPGVTHAFREGVEVHGTAFAVLHGRTSGDPETLRAYAAAVLAAADLLEQWRPVPDCVGFYEVSDAGRVRSVPRTICHPLTGQSRLRGVVLQPKTRKRDGYRTVSLCRDGRQRTVAISTLVLAAFAGPRPVGSQGCHDDGNPGNDRLTNLYWGTPTQNAHDTLRHGRNPWANRKHCPLDHLLRAPNLVASQEREGRRACLACSRGRANVQRATERGEVLDLRIAADRHYELIMSTVPAHTRNMMEQEAQSV